MNLKDMVIGQTVLAKTDKEAEDELSKIYDRLVSLVSDLEKLYPTEANEPLNKDINTGWFYFSNAIDTISKMHGLDPETESVKGTTFPADNPLRMEVLEFFKKNPYPDDDQIHQLAKDLGVESEILEREAYSIISDLLRMKVVGD